MMDHVRSYYQKQSLQIPKNIPSIPEISKHAKIVHGKYIKRTRKRKNKMKIITPLIKKRDSEEYKSSDKIKSDGRKMKLVLTKEHQSNQGVGKFSLKRVS